VFLRRSKIGACFGFNDIVAEDHPESHDGHRRRVRILFTMLSYWHLPVIWYVLCMYSGTVSLFPRRTGIEYAVCLRDDDMWVSGLVIQQQYVIYVTVAVCAHDSKRFRPVSGIVRVPMYKPI
jgi:hypothetical protein